MPQNASRAAGRHFLQIPGPTPLPDRVLRAMDTPHHRSSRSGIRQARQALPRRHQDHLQDHQSGDHLHRDRHRRVGSRPGQYAVARRSRADGRDRPVRHAMEDHGARSSGSSRSSFPATGAPAPMPAVIEEHLRKDKAHEIKAVCVLHNETATGCLSPIEPIRKAIDAAGHPALLMVDTISSLASTDYRHDEWGVDVTVGGAQKGLMLPPGMSFNAISDKALARLEDVEAAEVVLGVGRHADHEQGRLLPLHAGDPDAAGPRGRDRHAARGRPRQRVRPPRPARRSDPARGARLGARNPVPRSEILFADHHRGAAAGRPRRRRLPRPGARHFQYLLRRELRPLRQKIFPHRPSRRRQ